MKLTDHEKVAIRSLQHLAENWPKSLWLFSASASLHVMKCGPDGKQVMIPLRGCAGGGVDPAYSVAKVDIPNDGGDW